MHHFQNKMQRQYTHRTSPKVPLLDLTQRDKYTCIYIHIYHTNKANCQENTEQKEQL